MEFHELEAKLEAILPDLVFKMGSYHTIDSIYYYGNAVDTHKIIGASDDYPYDLVSSTFLSGWSTYLSDDQMKQLKKILSLIDIYNLQIMYETLSEEHKHA